MRYFVGGVRSCIALCAAAILAACAVEPQPSPAPSSEPLSVRTNVEILASDAFEGRMTGTIGIQQAAEHIVAELEAIGAVPLPGSDGYRLAFQYTGNATDGGTSLGVIDAAGCAAMAT